MDSTIDEKCFNLRICHPSLFIVGFRRAKQLWRVPGGGFPVFREACGGSDRDSLAADSQWSRGMLWS